MLMIGRESELGGEDEGFERELELETIVVYEEADKVKSINGNCGN